MKIMIQTQYRENYGAHDWDGEGECPQYWKFKGGDTYVVTNLSVAEAMDPAAIVQSVAPLIEYRNEASEEYILNWVLLDDCEPNGNDPWESPFELRCIDGKWVATRTVENGEYGYMNPMVERKTEEYDMMMGGERANYRAVYTMRNGDMVTNEEVNEYMQKVA